MMLRGNYDRTGIKNDSVIKANGSLTIKKKVHLKDRIFLSPVVKYLLPMLIAITCLMTGVYMTMYLVWDDTNDIWLATCNIRSSYRVDCFPGRSNITYEVCISAGCCWHDKTEICFHSVPSRHGYTTKDPTNSYQKNEILVPRRSTGPLGTRNTRNLMLDVREHSDRNHIELVFKIIEPTVRAVGLKAVDIAKDDIADSFSEKSSGVQSIRSDGLNEELSDFIPGPVARQAVNILPGSESVDCYVHTPEFSVTVTKKNNNSHSLLTTARGPLIMTENYWELTLYLTNSSLYGLNDFELNGTTNWFYDNENSTSRLAFLGINESGEGVSCYVDHNGPVEIKVMNESNLIIMRGLSLPSELSIHVFAGPSPLEAVQQLTKAMGKSEFDTIDVSNLGLHVCPEDDSKDYKTSLSNFIEKMKENGTPWDTHCIHQHFNPTLGNPVDNEIVTGFREILDKEKEKRIIIPHLTPMVFNNTLSKELSVYSMLLKSDSEFYKGSYKGNPVYYPDWHDGTTMNMSAVYFADYIEKFGDPTFIYLIDSWPRDDTKGHLVLNSQKFHYIPFELQSLMTKSTIPATLISSARGKSHFSEHAMYSQDFQNFTNTNSNWKGNGLFVQSLSSESTNASWSQFKIAIRVAAASGIVGQLPPSMYACGNTKFLDNTEDDELCSRWYGAAVAWPRVLATPSNLPGGGHLITATSSTYVSKHLKMRSSMTTYAYTLLATYYVDGSPYLSPTSLHYPRELEARQRPEQFMWGDALLVGLVTAPRVSQAHMWVPGKYPWRHLNGNSIVNPSKIVATPITAVEGQVVILIRPGYIIPVHENVEMTSASTMKNPITLFTNFGCKNCTATGRIFYGSKPLDGAFLSITANRTLVKFENVEDVKNQACGSNKQQATLYSKIVVCGNEHKIEWDLCTNSTKEIPLVENENIEC